MLWSEDELEIGSVIGRKTIEKTAGSVSNYKCSQKQMLYLAEALERQG